MNTLAILLLFIQACFLQNVFSQCTSRAAVTADPSFIAPGQYGLGAPYGYDGLAGWGATPYGCRGGYPDIAYPGAVYPGVEIAAYGGIGEGNVAVAGELPVAGSTVITGQVPIMGAVRFGGDIPAAGVVSITGKCACGCGAPYEYLY